MTSWIDANAVTIVDGVAYGVLLFTIAIGLSLTFGVANTLNLAHGVAYLGGAYVAVEVLGSGQYSALAFFAALALAAVAGLAGGGVLTMMVRPLLSRGHLEQALLTLGVSYVVADLYSLKFGHDVRAIAPPAFADSSVSIVGNAYPVYRLMVIGAGLVIAAGAYLVIDHTRAGARIKASVADAPMVRALGVRSGLLIGGIFVVGTALAAVGGVLGGPILSAYPGLDNQVLILGLVIVVIGGLSSIGGALVGALIVGQVQTLGVSLAPSVAPFLTFGCMALVLVFKPAGLLSARSQS